MDTKNLIRTAALATLCVIAAGCGDDDSARLDRLGLPSPDYQADAMRGGRIYADNCRECHGPGARGSDKGPPLLHPYYVPGHHADFAFFSAIKQGVKQHHWQYGDMPPQPQIDPRQAADVIAYLRSLQERHGLR